MNSSIVVVSYALLTDAFEALASAELIRGYIFWPGSAGEMLVP